MWIYIDANVYLSFYFYTSEDLEELRKLVATLEGGNYTLILPRQTIDEFKRKRETVIADALKRLSDEKVATKFPAISKEFDEYAVLQRLQVQYAQEHENLITKIRETAKAGQLKADQVIDALFEKAKVIETTDEIFGNAERRRRVGNPPGKRDSLGDAINWESVLSDVPEGGDAFIVTDDNDYYSELDRNRPKEFLATEWRKKKRTDIVLYRRISQFFKHHFQGIRFAEEIERDRFVQAFVTSGSFQNTHLAVSRLNEFNEFSAEQINAIVSAALENSQVNWVICDPDVRDFLQPLLDMYSTVINVENAAELRYELSACDRVPDEFGEDIPF